MPVENPNPPVTQGSGLGECGCCTGGEATVSMYAQHLLHIKKFGFTPFWQYGSGGVKSVWREHHEWYDADTGLPGVHSAAWDGPSSFSAGDLVQIEFDAHMLRYLLGSGASSSNDMHGYYKAVAVVLRDISNATSPVTGDAIRTPIKLADYLKLYETPIGSYGQFLGSPFPGSSRFFKVIDGLVTPSVLYRGDVVRYADDLFTAKVSFSPPVPHTDLTECCWWKAGGTEMHTFMFLGDKFIPYQLMPGDFILIGSQWWRVAKRVPYYLFTEAERLAFLAGDVKKTEGELPYTLWECAYPITNVRSHFFVESNPSLDPAPIQGGSDIAGCTRYRLMVETMEVSSGVNTISRSIEHQAKQGDGGFWTEEGAAGCVRTFPVQRDDRIVNGSSDPGGVIEFPEPPLLAKLNNLDEAFFIGDIKISYLEINLDGSYTIGAFKVEGWPGITENPRLYLYTPQNPNPIEAKNYPVQEKGYQFTFRGVDYYICRSFNPIWDILTFFTERFGDYTIPFPIAQLQNGYPFYKDLFQNSWPTSRLPKPIRYALASHHEDYRPYCLPNGVIPAAWSSDGLTQTFSFEVNEPWYMDRLIWPGDGMSDLYQNIPEWQWSVEVLGTIPAVTHREYGREIIDRPEQVYSLRHPQNEIYYPFMEMIVHNKVYYGGNNTILLDAYVGDLVSVIFGTDYDTPLLPGNLEYREYFLHCVHKDQKRYVITKDQLGLSGVVTIVDIIGLLYVIPKPEGGWSHINDRFSVWSINNQQLPTFFKDYCSPWLPGVYYRPTQITHRLSLISEYTNAEFDTYCFNLATAAPESLALAKSAQIPANMIASGVEFDPLATSIWTLEWGLSVSGSAAGVVSKTFVEDGVFPGKTYEYFANRVRYEITGAQARFRQYSALGLMCDVSGTSGTFTFDSELETIQSTCDLKCNAQC